MKEEMLTFLADRTEWHRQEQLRLKADDRHDEAAHMQIAMNVYGIFKSVFQASRYDVDEALRRFGGIVSTWDEQHKLACSHEDAAKQLVEEMKISRALEIIRYAKGLEGIRHD